MKKFLKEREALPIAMDDDATMYNGYSLYTIDGDCIKELQCLLNALCCL